MPCCDCVHPMKDLEGHELERQHERSRKSEAGSVGLPRERQVHKDVAVDAGDKTAGDVRGGVGKSQKFWFGNRRLCLLRYIGIRKLSIQNRWFSFCTRLLAYIFIGQGDATDIRYQVLTNCDLQMVGDEFSRKPYAIAVQQGSPLKEQFNDAWASSSSIGVHCWLPFVSW